MRRYKIDFALIVITGNLARYKTIRRIVEQDESVASRWYPIRTWVLNDPLRILPGSLRIRGRHLVDSFKLFVSPQADAIVIHAFETYPLFCVLRWLFRWKTIVVQNPDGGLPKGRPGVLGWPHRLAIRSTAQFVPWSNWAADSIRQEHPSIDETRIQVLHPGIDLEQWTMRLNSRSVGGSQGRFQILFVGGDLARKGANTLLDAYESSLSETCELHIATQTAQVSMNIEHFLARAARFPHIYLHLDLQPNSAELQSLYQSCDVFVLPTNFDCSSIVSLEAMATGIPVITTAVGGIPDIVHDGETGLLVPPRDADALTAAIERLRLDEKLRHRLTMQARRHVETSFDARKNTDQLLSYIKALVDRV